MAQKNSKKSASVRGFISSFGLSREGKEEYEISDTDNYDDETPNKKDQIQEFNILELENSEELFVENDHDEKEIATEREKDNLFYNTFDNSKIAKSREINIEEDELTTFNNTNTEATKTIMANNTTLIAAETVIIGSINSVSEIIIAGNVEGKITCNDNVTISGKVNGDITALNVTIENAEVIGAIEVVNDFKLIGGSTKGDVIAKNISVDGTIEGNLMAENKCEVCSKAVVMGDITAASVSIVDNSVINGRLSINHSSSTNSKE